jgi:hypothetical protein
MKKFEQFINELKHTTYSKASKKLKEKGQVKRAERLSKHSYIHQSKMEILKSYPELNPFEFWVDSKFLPDNKNNSNKVTAYLYGWGYIPAEDNECQAVIISPCFIFNSQFPLIGDLDKKEHFKGIDEYLEMEYMFQLDYNNDKVVDLYSFEGQTNYYKFTNRRDAVRFKKLIESDPIFMNDLVASVNGCDELNPFLIQKEFVNSIKINDLYI